MAQEWIEQPWSTMGFENTFVKLETKEKPEDSEDKQDKSGWAPDNDADI
jgi:hypothetical protein